MDLNQCGNRRRAGSCAQPAVIAVLVTFAMFVAGMFFRCAAFGITGGVPHDWHGTGHLREGAFVCQMSVNQHRHGRLQSHCGKQDKE